MFLGLAVNLLLSLLKANEKDTERAAAQRKIFLQIAYAIRDVYGEDTAFGFVQRAPKAEAE